jgi:competence protein ComFB
MKLHNQMEDLVLAGIEEIFSSKTDLKIRGHLHLRPMPPRHRLLCPEPPHPQYIISGRGLAHLESDSLDLQQKKADIVALLHEGIREVARAKRPFFTHDSRRHTDQPEGPFFNFPIMSGKIFNGTTFQPESDLVVTLRSEGTIVKMIDPNWLNPYQMVDNTPGNYLFWPYPAVGGEIGETRSFSFEVLAEKEGFDPVRGFVSLELTAEKEFIDSCQLQRTMHIDDLFIFPPSKENER